MVGDQCRLVGKDVLCLSQLVPVLILQICFLGGNVRAPEVSTMGSMFDDAALVHKNCCYMLYIAGH